MNCLNNYYTFNQANLGKSFAKVIVWMDNVVVCQFTLLLLLLQIQAMAIN